MPATAALPNDAFATADSGADYFATDAHYQSLASRIVAVFRAGHSFVLVVKDATMSAELLGKALTKLAAPRHAVIEIAARPETTCDEVLRAAPERVLLPQRDALPAAPPPNPAVRQPAPLFVIDDADRLSYEKLEQIYDALQPDDLVTPAIVLIAQEEFVTRLDRPALRFLKEALSGQFRYTQLAREEVATYIHHQLRATGTTSAFPAETIAAIADVAEGDASVVNRLARLVIDFAATSGGAAGATPAPEILEASAPKEAQIHEFGPRLQEVNPKPYDTLPPRPEPVSAMPRGGAQRSRAASILLKAFGESGRPAPANEPPIIEGNERGSLRRAPVGILVALAYIAVVSAASIGVFWVLHPTAKNFVTTGVHDVSLALNQLGGTLFAAKKPMAPPVQTAERPTASATAPIPPSSAPVAQSESPPVIALPAPSTPSFAARVAPPEAVATAEPPTPSAANSPAKTAAAEPPPAPAPAPLTVATTDAAATPQIVTSAPPIASSAPVVPQTAPPATPSIALPVASAPPPVPSLPATTSDAALPPTPSLVPLATRDTPPTLSTDADERTAASDAATADALASDTNKELDALSPPAAPVTEQANLPSSTDVPSAPADATATAAGPHLSATEIADLLKRGNDLVGVGDIISARLYFERAADAGNARAALLVGQTFDPRYLSRIGVFGVRGDPTAAAEWYQRARDLGDSAADVRLKTLAK